MTPSKNPEKEEQRKRIEQDIAEFLENGGRVQVIPLGKTAQSTPGQTTRGLVSWEEINEENNSRR